MDVKVAGSRPVYHPNANDESNNSKAAKGKESKRIPIRVRGESAKKRGGATSIYAKAKKTKFSITKGSKSSIK